MFHDKVNRRITCDCGYTCGELAWMTMGGCPICKKDWEIQATGQPRCETCIFWKNFTAGKATGDCHRFPPKVAGIPDGVDSGYASTEWPMTDASEWCGEYQSKENQ